MIVTCESCNTKFRLDPARLKPGRSKLRCSRCGHTFFVGPEETEEDILRFDPLEDPYPSAQGLAAAPRVEISEAPAAPAKSKPGKKRSFRTPLVILCLLLVVGGGFWFMTSRETAPVTDSAPKQTAPPPQQVQPANVTILENTQAYFLENAYAGQIFVVEGEVANESSRPVGFILLEGKLYTKMNQVAQSQRCYSGNPMSRNELTKLNMNDIQNRMMNREGKDMSNVQIPPAKRVPFMLVFHNLPEVDALTDYSVEVVSVD